MSNARRLADLLDSSGDVLSANLDNVSTYSVGDGGLTTNDFTNTDHSKLNAIEASATADQTNAEIKTAYEANSDTNEFSDAEQTKLAAIEASATADQTNAEIKTAYEANSDTNEFSDAEQTKLSGIATSANNYSLPTASASALGGVKVGSNLSIASGVLSSSYTDTDTTYSAGTGITLAGTTFSASPVALTTVQAAATQSAQLALTAQEGDVVVRSDENKSYMHNGGSAGTMADYTLLATPTDTVLSVNGATGAVSLTHDGFSDFVANEHLDWTADQGSTNLHSGNYTDTTYSVGDGGLTQINFTSADNTKLDGIEASATADQTNAEIKAAVEAATDSNTFTDADHSKLNAIEASATADQTNAEIKTAYEANSDTNEFSDAEQTKLSGIATSANNYSHPSGAGNLHVATGGSVGQLLTNTASGTGTWQNAPVSLPSQSGNTGKQLTTDGSTASWTLSSHTQGVLYEHANSVSSAYTISTDNNAMSAGPISIEAGGSVAIPSSSTWIIS